MQIRTLAQHIWAAASHDLQYKKERAAGIDDIASLSDLLDRRVPDALSFDAQIVSALKNPGAAKGNARLADLNPERIARGVYYCYEGLVRKMLEFEKGAIKKARGRADPQARQ